jgi:hypothetical protein
MSQSYSFTITGIEPPDFWHYPEPVRRKFWKAVVNLGLTAKDSELAAGLDRFGQPLHPIAESTRKHRRSFTGFADPSAPPLIPAYAESRTRILLTGRALKDRAQFFWRANPVGGGSWGRILGYHRKGGKRLPVRDVIGLAPEAVNQVRVDAWKEWEAIKKGAEASAVKPRPGRIEVPQAPTRIKVVGRTDFENAVFAEGGGMARSQAALAAGMATGFRQFRAAGPPIPPPLIPPRPERGKAQRLRPVPALVPAAVPVRSTSATAAEAIPPPPPAPTFVQGERERDAGRKPVTVLIAALDEAWKAEALTKGFYIPPGGGSDKQKYRNAVAFLIRAALEGIKVEMPRVEIGADGSVAFTDGRHRFAAMRDMAAKRMPVSIDPTEVKTVRQRFGVKRKKV